MYLIAEGALLFRNDDIQGVRLDDMQGIRLDDIHGSAVMIYKARALMRTEPFGSIFYFITNFQGNQEGGHSFEHTYEGKYHPAFHGFRVGHGVYCPACWRQCRWRVYL